MARLARRLLIRPLRRRARRLVPRPLRLVLRLVRLVGVLALFRG